MAARARERWQGWLCRDRALDATRQSSGEAAIAGRRRRRGSSDERLLPSMRAIE